MENLIKEKVGVYDILTNFDKNIFWERGKVVSIHKLSNVAKKTLCHVVYDDAPGEMWSCFLF